MVAIVVAASKNNVIGKSNDLPWYLPADLKHFKEITTGGTVIMGRKTYESIAHRLGGPLPNRRNIVVTRGHRKAEGVEFVHSVEDALRLASSDKNIYVIGGAQIFDQSIEFVDTVYLTEIDAVLDGDTFLPRLNVDQWMEVSREEHQKDEKNQYDYTFVTLQRAR